jgi:hypothetical protein
MGAPSVVVDAAGGCNRAQYSRVTTYNGLQRTSCTLGLSVR